MDNSAIEKLEKKQIDGFVFSKLPEEAKEILRKNGFYESDIDGLANCQITSSKVIFNSVINEDDLRRAASGISRMLCILGLFAISFITTKHSIRKLKK